MATEPRDLPQLECRSAQAWTAWLAEHHASSPGVWLVLAKGGAAGVTYAEALDAALCHGWIDGQKRSRDGRSFLQKFTPRARRSGWSKINREKVARLIAAGRMRAPGLAEVERAKADGRWEAAYDSARQATVPDDLERALAASPEAAALWPKLSGANRYAILYRVQTAKRAETRARRIAELVAMLARGETIHPQRRCAAGGRKRRPAGPG